MTPSKASARIVDRPRRARASLAARIALFTLAVAGSWAFGTPSHAAPWTPDASQRALRERIESGLPVTWIVHFADPGSGRERVRSCRVSRDLWQGSYEVRAGERAPIVTRDAAAAIDACAQGADGARVVAIECDPITARTARGLSTWITHAEGGLGAPTFFGALVGRVAFREAERDDVAQ